MFALRGLRTAAAPFLRTLSTAPLPTSGESLLTDRKAAVILEDGSVFMGQSFGSTKSVAGEVIFSTGMVGYVENMTDPSYRGQILTLTYPLMGNYGVPSGDKDHLGLAGGMESDRIQVSGLVVSSYTHLPSHWQSRRTLSQWLKDYDVPAVYGIDTRALTKKLREHGSIKGKIVMDHDIPLIDPNSRHLVKEVSRKEPQVFGNGSLRIIAIDCGMKHNIIRKLMQYDITLKVVPFDYDFRHEEYDGLFISNGPGDPAKCVETVENLRWALQQDKPIFGICLGNQLMARAAGCETYKLPFGNRGHNQPVRDMLTNRVYITPQNHGYAVDQSTIPIDWHPYFVNINDSTNEGIIHGTKPFFSVQFHPEASGGPEDTSFLFDKFITAAREFKEHRSTSTLYTSRQYFRNSKILLLGSGGLQIGQAGEFDYSGSQAIKALREEKCQVVLMNPNIATVQTSKGLADAVYFLPLTPHFIEQVIIKEKPDALMLGFGGQTALNVGVALEQSGVLRNYNVRVLGSPVSSIIAAEDREIFKRKLEEIGERLAPSVACNSVEESVVAAKQLGYPIMARAAFTLGGLGSGFAHNEEELRVLAAKALATSPQLLIERSIKGWKEVEYEVVRDAYDNAVTVCNMENFDPMGIHTGESIVIAPSQTLSNDEYHMLRSTAIKVVRHLGIIGECNIQYALDPNSLEYCIIEVNPRLSRSSALASKATGYPLAAVAARLSLGIELEVLPNAVTKCTTAAFEPSLDYCVVKFPKWDLAKFTRVSSKIGSQMRSVGEVMAIGRSYLEAMQKAIRMVDPRHKGFEPKERMSKEDRDEELRNPTDQRIFAIADAFYNADYSVEDIFEITRIDRWFLYQLHFAANLSKALVGRNLDSVSGEEWLLLKRSGFSDVQLAERLNTTQDKVRETRKRFGVTPWVKQIDTLAAEFPAATNYLYLTYHGSEHDVKFDEHGSMVIGCGTYRIGSSVEFDFGSVWALRTLRKMGKRTIMVNCNPETVSTDFDECERLYFDELSLERILDINDLEDPEGVLVSFGGQTPNNLVIPLHKRGVKILGTTPDSIDAAEDRSKHSDMLDEIGVKQPAWIAATSIDQAKNFGRNVGFPLLVRPSYVLSGAAMNVVENESELEHYLSLASSVSPDHPVVVSKFLQDANEIDLDAVAAKGELVAYAISEHVEKGGVHSGDATLILPSRDLSQPVFDELKSIAAKIARRLNISGPFNMQVLEKNGELFVIETNLRASRSLPFSSKVIGVDMIELATRAVIGDNVPYQTDCDKQRKLPFVAVKAPQFSWKRLPGADPLLGVEMASTGEVACFHPDKWGAYLRSLQATHMVLPVPNSTILVVPPKTLNETTSKALSLLASLGYKIVASAAHAATIRSAVPSVASVPVPSEEVTNKRVTLVVDLEHSLNEEAYELRRFSVDFAVPLVVNDCQLLLLAEALQKYSADPAVVPFVPIKNANVESFSEVI